jgi:hypothetical protein
VRDTLAKIESDVGDAAVGFLMLVGIGFFIWAKFFSGPSEVEVIKALSESERLDRVLLSIMKGSSDPGAQKISHDQNNINIVVRCTNAATDTCGYTMFRDFNKMVVMAKEVGASLAGKVFKVSYTTDLIDKYGNDSGVAPILTAEWKGDELAKVSSPSDDKIFTVAALADRVEFSRFGRDDYAFICKDANDGHLLRFCSSAKK